MKLYAITDEILTPDRSVLKQTKEALHAGVKIIQYRNKSAKDEDIFHICKILKNLCEDFGADFIINDRLDLACELKAHGLHLGKDDTSLKFAKKKFRGFIGVSCYDDIDLAKSALNDGASYVAFGAFFSSFTKPDAKKANFQTLKKARDLGFKTAVIGGINAKNINQFFPYSPDMICAISSIFKGNIEENVKALLKAYKD